MSYVKKCLYVFCPTSLILDLVMIKILMEVRKQFCNVDNKIFKKIEFHGFSVENISNRKNKWTKVNFYFFSVIYNNAPVIKWSLTYRRWNRMFKKGFY